jgi:signal peptidase I, bacterial type
MQKTVAVPKIMLYNNLKFVGAVFDCTLREVEIAMAKNMKNQTAGETPDPFAASKEIYDWILCLLFALIVCVLLFSFVFHAIDVVGSSMVPTLHNGDKMLVSGLFYKPKAGDVVVFTKDEYDPNKALVKRVIAVEGQEINMDFANGIVYIDGEPISEPYINELTFNKLDFIGPKTVPEGCVFVMGDNRNASVDSRKKEIGMLDTRLILGRAYYVVFPLSVLRAIR